MGRGQGELSLLKRGYSGVDFFDLTSKKTIKKGAYIQSNISAFFINIFSIKGFGLKNPVAFQPHRILGAFSTHLSSQNSSHTETYKGL